jgi:hypothetical protein
MKILDEVGNKNKHGLMEYLRCVETLQTKRPAEELKTAICLYDQRRDLVSGKATQNIPSVRHS